jgi:hypothetical protein
MNDENTKTFLNVTFWTLVLFVLVIGISSGSQVIAGVALITLGLCRTYITGKCTPSR